MTFTLQAIYEQGMLRLMQPVDLPEGTSVQVIITANDSTQENKNTTDILAQIAALPLEGDRDNFSGFDHDRILYPHQK
ncbi:antitoxin family protein [Limnospira fusiformis KN01]|uniref:Antitoxin family protein n=1 Tax=Limnospira fusiformis PMC 851.14 TaxID=2219512 RepID=A0ABU9ERU0_LIMFS|nr:MULTISPECIES: antitoxin family protein [Limnospira]QJB25349.1 antitoxin family protein [Limnospira fusiformis SAG 85.79]RAQ41264.1 DUF104 domain-containing protein [Arthrospira sp. O9.13F]UWU47082.1 putative DNA-binding protein, potential antitoxin AbrB/MazE fold [Arthrospira platensis C1]MDT9191053.1 antitoxin family protein [Limnospira sp. PMC 894.15]MDT9201339.1 antitoxin family protein [Limnospira sp. PMC 1042.18]